MKKLKKVCAMIVALSVSACCIEVDTTPMLAKEEKLRDYIICTKSENQVESIEKEYKESGEINKNAKEFLQENHMTSVQMSESEAKKMEDEKGIYFVEEDVVLEASTTEKKGYHKKQVKKIKENKSENEWNVRMIHSDKLKKLDKKTKKKDNNKRVKIAVLDSGVDWGNDIDVVQTITLVPGEEEMSPLFMDGTGHGDSVAGLIAAKDNGEGITGVNPNAEIYSIRVLDDTNTAPVSRVVEAIYQAIEWDVNIINMSFGVNEYSEALKKAIQDAHNAGILIIAAAGNTGEAGVQYPAAFDEVMAVGSVDKYGDVVDNSAKGEEIEIVAPGELVRSTGFFGSELVESGTSLAAPQVAAVASLIWEKDLSVSADFVRALLNESANAYGETDAYGNGLVDAQYALENYETFKKQYQENEESAQLEENVEEVMSFEETNCVEGCWSVNNHGKLVPSTNSNVQKGARFPDTESAFYKGGVVDNRQLYYFSGMDNNPWWHGYYKKKINLNQEEKKNQLNNYIAAYIYETKLANQMTTHKVLGQDGLKDCYKKEINNSIGRIDWKREFGNIPSDGTKRAFIWGMAIHNLADSFAHSTAINGKRITHDKSNKEKDADNKDYHPKRWDCAVAAVKIAMSKYKDKKNGGLKEYQEILNQKDFKMINIYRYVKEIYGEEKASNYKKKSVEMK